LGAAGAVEAVLTVQTLRDRVVPATLNLKNLDPRSTSTWCPGVPGAAASTTRSAIHSPSAATTSRWCSALPELMNQAFSQVNWHTSVQPWRNRSAQPVR
jgi:3-oxoacyl-(acyl-carrier-protein) synthase